MADASLEAEIRRELYDGWRELPTPKAWSQTFFDVAVRVAVERVQEAQRVAGVEIQRLQAALGELSARSGRAHAILRGDQLPRLSDAARIWEATDALAGVLHTPQPAGPTVRSLGDPE